MAVSKTISPFDATVLSEIALRLLYQGENAKKIATELMGDLKSASSRRIAEALLTPVDQRGKFPSYAQEAAAELESQVSAVETKIKRFNSAS